MKTRFSMTLMDYEVFRMAGGTGSIPGAANGWQRNSR